jgi:hypothetical protein
VPVALDGDTVATRTEQSPAGTCAWKTVPNTLQTECGSCSIGGFR